ncbi:hypothetical protein BVY03_04240, partial [bacterium K02(2017)]
QRLLLCALEENKNTGFNTYNIAADHAMPIGEIVSWLKLKLSSKSKVMTDNNSMSSYTVDLSKLKNSLNFTPQTVHEQMEYFYQSNQ